MTIGHEQRNVVARPLAARFSDAVGAICTVWREAARRASDTELIDACRKAPVAMSALLVFCMLALSALLAPWLAPQNPFDPAQLDLLDSRLPPAWVEGGSWRYIFGTDDQGRDLFSAIAYGMRISLSVSLLGVLLAAVVGIGLGLIAAHFGGLIDAAIMRLADVFLTFPALLIALLVDGIATGAIGDGGSDGRAFTVLVVAIAMAFWVQYARTVRAAALVEREKDYVLAARLAGASSVSIMLRHILPNVASPLIVLATVNLALAILTEATLSFLGVGIPPTEPSLGTLIRVGNDFLFSGEWWITFFPACFLVALVLSVNMFGDWLRDFLNPQLR